MAEVMLNGARMVLVRLRFGDQMLTYWLINREEAMIEQERRFSVFAS